MYVSFAYIGFLCTYAASHWVDVWIVNSLFHFQITKKKLFKQIDNDMLLLLTPNPKIIKQ